MLFSLFVARHYLFRRSNLGASGWISLISAIAIGVVVAALVSVLAVYNGYASILLEGEEQRLPDLVVRSRGANYFNAQALLPSLERSNVVASQSGVIHTEGILHTDLQDFPLQIKGIDSNYRHVTGIDKQVFEGIFPRLGIASEVPEMLIGIGLAMEGATRGGERAEVELILPRRQGFINPLALSSAFIRKKFNVSGILKTNNEQMNRQVYTDISELREMLALEDGYVSELALKVKSGETVQQAKVLLGEMLGAHYDVLNREEQQPELTMLIKVEKVMVYAIMLFVLLLAAFNLASSLVILIVEKWADIQTLKALGASKFQLSGVFANTGIATSAIGSLVGMVVGVGFCLLQSKFGLISSGEGITRMPFPIELQVADLVWTLVSVFIISVVSASLPIVFLRRK